MTASYPVVLWHLLRVAVLWAVLAAGVVWGWVRWGDVEPWTAWISGVVAIHIAVPAYALTGLGRRLGHRAMTRGQLVLGGVCLLVLTIGTTLALALLLRPAAPVSPSVPTLVVCTVFPAVVMAACFVTLPRLWHLGRAWGAAVSILLILGALSLCLLAVWQVSGGPDWLVPVLWVGSVAAFLLAGSQVLRVPMENMNSIQDLY
ncbi:hypothetical protein [Ornithinimicrobium cavernae]|uniref:hypothetical protein n=1 Tax=Ornithinimicrobium cavernae TaxID=2666047 RepID=UPI0012B181DC|nr:hypothetical protein [Ornithinimicrobium cavernae]